MIKTLQEWVEWAEFIDNNSDTDETQWEKKLVSCESEIEFLKKLRDFITENTIGQYGNQIAVCPLDIKHHQKLDYMIYEMLKELEGKK